MFGSFSGILTLLNKVDEAYRYAQLALRLQEKFDAREWVPRTHVIVYGAVTPFVEPVRNALDPLLEAHHAGLLSGDIEVRSSLLIVLSWLHFSSCLVAALLQFAMLSGVLYYEFSLFIAHIRLDRFVAELRSLLKLVMDYGQVQMRDFILPMLEVASNMLGVGATTDHGVLTGEAMEGDNRLTHAWSLQLQYLMVTHLHDFQAAERLSRRIRKSEIRSVVPYFIRVHHFHEGVAFAVLARQSSNRFRRRRLQHLARRQLGKLERYTLESPENFSNKLHLVQAELAMNCGKRDEAMVHFRRSMERAEAQGFVHEQALACERAGYALQELERGTRKDAREYLVRARQLYDKWGARTKVEKLDKVIAEAEKRKL